MATLARARLCWCHRTSGSSTATMAHLGLGAFARAHLGVYADDLNRLGRPALIRGVSLMSDRAEQQMGPQDGLYTVAEREPDDDVTLRVVGSMTSVRTGTAAVFDAVSAPTTDLVTVTITESGYDIPWAPPDLDPPSPWVPEIIARALAHHRQAGSAPPIVASLDNLLGNGEILRHGVLNSAERLDPTLPGWIAEEVAFPSSVVDRMVPAPTDDDRRDVEGRLGLLDLATVSAERYRSWILSEAEGLPPLADVGVEVVADVTPFERRKLWLLNGPHSAFAYCGLLAGCDTIASAVGNAAVPFLRAGDDRRYAGGGAIPGFPRCRPVRGGSAAPIRQSEPWSYLPAGGGRRVAQAATAPPPRHRRAPGEASRRQEVRACRGTVDCFRRRRGDSGSAAAGRGGPRRAGLRAAVTDGDLSKVVHMALGRTYDAAFCGLVVESLQNLARHGMASLRDAR